MSNLTKRFLAPAALIGGVSAAVLVGAPAHANSGSGYHCVNQSLVSVVNCVQVNPVVNIDIQNSPVLSGNDLSVLENDLNNTSVDVQDIDATVLNFYKSINVPINVGDIVVKL